MDTFTKKMSDFLDSLPWSYGCHSSGFNKLQVVSSFIVGLLQSVMLLTGAKDSFPYGFLLYYPKAQRFFILCIPGGIFSGALKMVAAGLLFKAKPLWPGMYLQKGVIEKTQYARHNYLSWENEVEKRDEAKGDKPKRFPPSPQMQLPIVTALSAGLMVLNIGNALVFFTALLIVLSTFDLTAKVAIAKAGASGQRFMDLIQSSLNCCGGTDGEQWGGKAQASCCGGTGDIDCGGCASALDGTKVYLAVLCFLSSLAAVTGVLFLSEMVNNLKRREIVHDNSDMSSEDNLELEIAMAQQLVTVQAKSKEEAEEDKTNLGGYAEYCPPSWPASCTYMNSADK